MTRRCVENILRRLTAVIAKGGEQVYKKTIKTKFDFDETKVGHIYNLIPINCFSHVNIAVQLL